ncbi:hypothetical protein [Pararhodobacter oceanensis]|uniref:hypothetical protein n=1 Tax=Pararhodobacter oceanensis TaxID=2172121 RepID=UPI003A8F4B6B
MTALDKYTRLEGSGIWRAAPEEQRRDVVVSLGNASLVIADARSEIVLSHWSLPAVQRMNRGNNPAIFAPAEDHDGETLELDDATLIEALETIRAALAPRQPLRWLRMALVAATVLLFAIGAYWLPGVVVSRTTEIVPPAMRAQIGRTALDSLFLGASGERICADPEGRQVLATLRNRVLGAGWQVSVVGGVPGLEVAHLPGQIMVIGADLLERLDSAEALTGWMLGEALALQAHDPLSEALHYAGLRATLGLMTTGALPEGSLAGYAAQLFAQPVVFPQAEALGLRLDALGQAPTAYALSLPEAQAGLAQALADRIGSRATRAPRLLSDGEWLTLQQICAD